MCVCIVSYLFTSLAWAEQYQIGVIYPKLQYPYSRVFDELLLGIEAEAPGQTIVTLDAIFPPARVKHWIAENKITSVIALGIPVYELSDFLPATVRLIQGGLLKSSDPRLAEVVGISLDPAPQRSLALLAQIAPKVRHVTVVYRSEQWAGYIQQAQDTGKSVDITVEGIQVRDLWGAAKAYRRLLLSPSGAARALWLVPDAEIMDGFLFDSILKMAWETEWVVISNTLAHVARGAFLSFYPDNRAIGRDLARLARAKSDAIKPGIVDSSRVSIAVNWRTARHLGIYIPHDRMQEIKLWFPDR